MEKYLKIMDKLIEYNNKLSDEFIENKETATTTGEKKAVERIMMMISKIMLDEKEIISTKNIKEAPTLVEIFEWAELKEPMFFNPIEKKYFINSEDYGYFESANIKDLKEQFKFEVRKQQLEDEE